MTNHADTFTAETLESFKKELNKPRKIPDTWYFYEYEYRRVKDIGWIFEDADGVEWFAGLKVYVIPEKIPLDQ